MVKPARSFAQQTIHYDEEFRQWESRKKDAARQRRKRTNARCAIGTEIDQRERLAELCRGIMIGRLDRMWADGESPLSLELARWERVLQDAGLSIQDSRAASMKLIQELQVVFFPEAFLEPAEIKDRRIEGLLPRGGGRAFSGPRLEALLAAMRAVA